LSSIVKFVEYTVNEDDRAAFDAFMHEFADYVRESSGCLFYEHLENTRVKDGGVMFAVWPDNVTLKRHERDPRHLDMLKVVSERWGLRDLHVNTWGSAEDYSAKVIASAGQFATTRSGSELI